MKKLFLFIMILNLLAACQSAKDALTLKKRNTADEFLVEKKKPTSFATCLWGFTIT